MGREVSNSLIRKTIQREDCAVGKAINVNAVFDCAMLDLPKGAGVLRKLGLVSLISGVVSRRDDCV